MSQFLDRALVQLHQAAALTTLIKGPGAAPYPQLGRLPAAVFDRPGAEIDHVRDASVLEVEPVVPVPGRDRVSGTWTATQPAPGLGDLRGEILREGDGPWAHLMAQVRLDVVVSTDGSGVEAVTMKTLEDIVDFADFESRFRYIDLPAYLAEHRITTVEELREAGPHLLAEIRLHQPPPFDPNDPANSYAVLLDLAVVVMDDLDLGGGLMQARRLWQAGSSQPPGPRSAVLGETVRPFAVAVVFPETALVAGQPSKAVIDGLYAACHVLPLFANPP